ncbi:hypothetical protein RRG08_003275 [Elysia crispata]|uniref:Tudor domain-containing protein n=1 Tax=Elysia crispata TaxID=231223 RepID=A0AAE1D0M1_9GAST|nr:hypothetical protein RRG08_003275 [Elysia crispata]
MEDYPIDFISNDSTEYVFTTHIKDPEHFYVHVESQTKILDDIMEALNDRYNNLGPYDRILNNKKLGGLCAAKFTDDNNWYRARITGLMKTGLIEVQFVDYGNTDYVSDDRVKSLDADLVQYPIQCYRCALANVSSTQGYWTPESTVKFEDKAMDQRCKAYFSGKLPDYTYLVTMIDGEGNSLNEMFGAVKASRNQQVSSERETAFKEIAWQIGAKVQATVAYVQSPDLFWCQDQSFANELLILSEELSRLHMTQGIQPLTDVRPGSICAAKFSEDEAWYRGVVQTVSNGEAQVYFVDYGNTESVPLSLICRLSASMRTMPALAAKCCLSGVSSKNGSWDQTIVDQFEEIVVDKEFEMVIIDRKGDTYIVSLVDIVENTDVSSQMRVLLGQSDGAPRATGISTSINSKTEEVAGVGPSLSMGSRVGTFLTWVDNPGDFWVQLKDFDYLVDKLSTELQEFYAKPRPGTSVSPGAFIVAKYSEDDMWYRGLVLKEVSDSEVLVLFIDYGNSDIVSKGDLRQVAPAFGEVVPLAFRCALVGVKPLSEDTKVWTTDAKNFLEEMTQDGCICEVINETESRKLVRLSVDGKDVASELASLRVVAAVSPNKGSMFPMYSKQVTVRKSERETVTVTHVLSPQDFWCQLNKNFATLDNLMAQLDAHYSDEGGTPIRNTEVGRACIAQYSEDNAWYRGKILDASSAGLTVQFIDYGNSELVPSKLVCEPEPRFLDLSIQAVHCSLPLERNVSHLTDTMTDLVLEKNLTMEVIDIRNEIAVVELYDGVSKVSDLLKQTSEAGTAGIEQAQAVGLKIATKIPVGSTVTAFVSYVDSPSKFFLQLADKEEELEALMDDISVYNAQSSGQEPLLNPQVNQACMALFSEDSQWYRGIIMSLQSSSCSVLFVDYGNEESVNYKDALRALPSEFGTSPALAYECSLEGMEGVTWTEEAQDFFESIIMDQELQCTFISQKSVKIMIDGKDIKSELIGNGFFKEKKANVSPKPFGVSSAKPQINGRSPEQVGSRWIDSEDVDQGASGFGPSKGFGGGDRNSSSGFGFKKTESSSGFGSNRDNSKPNFGSKGQGTSGFGGGEVQKERKTSTGSSAASGEFTYAEPPSEPETAILVHMDEDGTFYLQLPSMEKDILFLAKRLAGSYKNGSGPRLKDTPAKGVICCAKFPEDGCMYRCLVLDVNGGTAFLRYVDYGNTAECSFRDLKMLFPDLLQYSVQAYPCKLKGLAWSVDQAEKFASATLDQNLEVTFSGVSPPYEVEVKTPNGDLLDILTGKVAFTSPQKSQADPGSKQKGFGSGSASPKQNAGGGFGSSKSSLSTGRFLPSSASKICEQKYVAQNVPVNQVEAYICHIDEDGYFYLQLEKDTTTLESIMDQLEGLSGQHPNPSTDAACAAVFSEDSSWYRALINSVQGDSLKVTFIDYGNGSEVQKNSVKPLTDVLLSNAPLAFRCQFADLGPLPAEAQKKLSDYLMEHKVLATFSSQSSPYNVSIRDAEGNDLQEIVCPSDCYKTQSRPKNVIPAGVTCIEDDGRFYIQLYADFPAIAKLHQSLSETASSSSLEKLVTKEVGLACCFESEQKEWHRGQIQKVTDEFIEVIDVDTGKKTNKNADSLFQLPLHFFKNAPYGYECRLKGMESWTDDLRNKFTKMTEEKILNATFYTGTAPFRVSLARSIELDLLGLSAPMPDSPVKEKPKQSFTPGLSKTPGLEAYISHVDPDGTFYIQLVAREEDLSDLSDKLEEALASAETGDLSVAPVGAICCAMFTEDDAWYRAKVTATDADKGQVTVRFVDYGNTDTVEADRLTSLPEDLKLSVLPAFATKSRLSGVSDLSDDAVEKLKEAVLDQVVIVDVKIKVEDHDEVELKVAGTLLTDILGIQVAKTESGSAETSNSQEVEEFVDASEIVGVEAEAALNKNTNAEADEFTDAMEGIEEIRATKDRKEKQDVSERTSQDKPVVGSRMSVTVSFVVNPSEFYFQLDQKQDQYNLLLDQMFEHFSGLPEGEGTIQQDLSIGDLCAALYAEDESWYRSCVTEITDGSYTIFFIDHGNTEVAQADTLRVLHDQFRTLPPGAKKASLAGVRPATEEWSSEAIAEFKAHVEGRSLLADIISTRDDHTILRLLELGIPVHEELIKKEYGIASEEDIVINQAVQHIFAEDTSQESKSEGLMDVSENNFVERTNNEKAFRLTRSGQGLKIGSVANTIEELETVSVYVSCAESPSLFWCQLSDCIEILKEISDLLGAEYSDPENLKLTQEACIGDFVIARNSNDGLLYRSKILSLESLEDDNEDQQFKVSLQHIDFGIKGPAERDHMFKMESSLFRFPAQAFKCSLENVRPQQGDSWPQNVCEKFSEVVKDRELSLKLVGRDQDGTSLVELIDPQTSQSLSSLLIETEFGLEAAESVDKGTKKYPDSSLPGDTSTFDGLEITRPIMESTTMGADTTQAVQSFSINEGKDGCFRVYSLSLHTEYDVFICNEELPNAFHVRLLEMESQFTGLSTEIQQFIASEADKDTENYDPSVNDPCLVRVKEMWHRATVLERDELNWNVKLQDIGTEMSVDKKELRRLPQHLLEIPAQAIPCHLAGIVSVEPEWCTGAIDFFKDRTKDGKFCMYVLEDAHKGKYGVVISDLESSESNSVNRAMVDLGYAEVVPGSYIDIQLDMEKTLDTDMLNELEESFNEISLLKCNADDVGEHDEAACLVESGEIHIYFDSYKEGEISQLCKKKVDPHLYQLIQIVDFSTEGSKTGNDELMEPETCSLSSDKKNNFCLAYDVERIEQNGCLDIENSEADMDCLGIDTEISAGSSQPSSKEMHRSGNVIEEKTKAEIEKHKEEGKFATGHEALVVNVLPQAAAPKTKSIYTWKMEAKTSPVDKTVKVEAEKSEDVEEDNMLVKGEEADEEMHLESVKNEEDCVLDLKMNETEDNLARSKANHICRGSTEKCEISSTEVVSRYTTVEDLNKEEESSCNKLDSSGSNAMAPVKLNVDWKDLISLEENSEGANAPSVSGMQRAAEREEGATEMSFEKIDSSGEQTPSISPECLEGNILLEKDLQHDTEVLRSSITSEAKSLSDFRKRYMSSTPSRDVKSSKAQRKVKSGNGVTSKKSEKTLFADSSKANDVRYVGQEDPDSLSSSNITKVKILTAETRQIGNSIEDDDDQTKVEIAKGVKSKVEDLQYCEVDSISGPSKILAVEEVDYGQLAEAIEVIEEASIESGKSCSTETSKEESGNEATQFISCLGSDDSHMSSRDEEKVAGASLSSVKDSSIVQAECSSHKTKKEEKQSEDQYCVTKNLRNKEVSHDSSFENTVDEYESCSETGPEDSDNQGFVNSLVAIRGSLAMENLSISSFSDTSKGETSLDPASLFLSGSSFDTSAITSDTVSTLEKGEEEDFTPSQLEEDSYLRELLNRPGINTESSSSSCSCTSCEANGQELPSSSWTTENDSHGLQQAKDVLKNHFSQTKGAGSEAATGISIQNLKVNDLTNMDLSKKGGCEESFSDENIQLSKKIDLPKELAKSEKFSTSNVAIEERRTENPLQEQASIKDINEVIPVQDASIKEARTESFVKKVVAWEESGIADIPMEDIVAKADTSDDVSINSGMEAKRKSEDFCGYYISAKWRNIEKTDCKDIEDREDKNGDILSHPLPTSERGLNTCKADTTTEHFPNKDAAVLEHKTADFIEGRKENLVGQNQVAREGLIKSSYREHLITNEDHLKEETSSQGEQPGDDEQLKADETRKITSLPGEDETSIEPQKFQSTSMVLKEERLENICGQRDTLLIKEERLENICGQRDTLVIKEERLENICRQRDTFRKVEGNNGSLSMDHDDPTFRKCEDDLIEKCSGNSETKLMLQLNQENASKRSEETESCLVAEICNENASIEVKCKDESDDDTYSGDSQSKNATDMTELCADEKVLAGAPSLDLDDASEEADAVETKNETKEPECGEENKENSLEIKEANATLSSADTMEESQC